MEHTKKNGAHNSKLHHEVEVTRDRLQNIAHSFSLEWKSLLAFGMKVNDEDRRKEFEDLLVGSQNGMIMLRDMKKKRERKWLCLTQSSQCGIKRKPKFHQSHVEEAKFMVNRELLHQQILAYYKDRAMGFNVHIQRKLQLQVEHKNQKEYYRLMEYFRKANERVESLKGPGDITTEDVRNFLEDKYNRRVLSMTANNFLERLKLFHISHRYQIRQRMLDIADNKDPLLFHIDGDSNNHNETINNVKVPVFIMRPDQLTFEIESLMIKLGQSFSKPKDITGTGLELRLAVFQLFNDDIEKCKNMSMYQSQPSDIQDKSSEVEDDRKTKTAAWPFDATRSLLHQIQRETISRFAKKPCEILSTEMSTLGLYDAEFIQNRLEFQVLTHLKTGSNISDIEPKYDVADVGSSLQKGKQNTISSEPSPQMRENGAEMSRDKLYSFYLLRHLVNRKWRMSSFRILNYFRYLLTKVYASENDTTRRLFTVEIDGEMYVKDRTTNQELFLEESHRDLRDLEAVMVDIGSFYILKDISNNSSVDRGSVISDLLECEVSFLRSKLKLVRALDYIVQNVPSSCPSYAKLVQVLVNIIHMRPVMNMSEKEHYFWESYAWETIQLDLQSSLLTSFMQYIHGDPAGQSKSMIRKTTKDMDAFQEILLETETQSSFLCSFFELYEENMQALVRAWPNSAYEAATYLSLQRSVNEKLLILWNFVRKEALSLPQHQLERLDARDYFRGDFVLSSLWMMDCCLSSSDKGTKVDLLQACCHAVAHFQLQEAFQRQCYRAKILEKLLAIQRDFPNCMESPDTWANLYLTGRDMDTNFVHGRMSDELKLTGSLSQWIEFHLDDEKNMILVLKALQLQEAWSHLLTTSLEFNHLLCAETIDFAAMYPFLLKRQNKDSSNLSSKVVRTKHIDRIKDRISDEFQRNCTSFFLIPEEIKTSYIEQVSTKDALSYIDKIDALIKHLNEESELQGALVDLNEIVDGFRIEADLMTNKLNLECAFSSGQKESLDEWFQKKINDEPKDDNSKRNRKMMSKIYQEEKSEERYTSQKDSSFNLLNLPSRQALLARFRTGGALEEKEIKKSKRIEMQHLFLLYSELETLFQLVEIKHSICWSDKITVIDVGRVKTEIHKEISHLHKRWIDVLDMNRINTRISGGNIDSNQHFGDCSIAILQDLSRETLLVVKCTVGLLLQHQLMMIDRSQVVYQSTNATDQEKKCSRDFDDRSCEALRNLYNSFSNGEELGQWCKSLFPLHVPHSCRIQATDWFISIEHALDSNLTSEARFRYLERLAEVISLKVGFLDGYAQDKAKIMSFSSPNKAAKHPSGASAILEKLLDERSSMSYPGLNSGSILIPDFDCMERQIHTLRDLLEKTLLEEDILQIQRQYDSFLRQKIEITTKQVDTKIQFNIPAKQQQHDGLMHILSKYLRVDHMEGNRMADPAYIIPQNEIYLFMEDIVTQSLKSRDIQDKKAFEDLTTTNKFLSNEINQYEEKIQELKKTLEDNLRQEEIKREASVIDRTYRLILAVEQMKKQIITTKEELKIEKAEIHAKLTADYELQIRDLTTRLLTMSQQFEDYRNKIQHDMRSQVFDVQERVLRNVIDSGTVPVQTKGNLLKSFQDEVDKDTIIEENHALKQALLKLKTLYEVKHTSEVASFEMEKAALNAQLVRSKEILGDKIILDDRVKKLESELIALQQEKSLLQSKLSFMESNFKTSNKTKAEAKIKKPASTTSDTEEVSERLKKKLFHQATNELDIHEEEDEEELKKYEEELRKKSIEAPSMKQQEKFEAKRMSIYLNSTKHLQNEIKRLQHQIQREIKLKNTAMEQVQHFRNQIDERKEGSMDKIDQSQLNLQYADALKEIAQLKLKLLQSGVKSMPYHHLETSSSPAAVTRKYIQTPTTTTLNNIPAHQERDLRPSSTSATGRNVSIDQTSNELVRPSTRACNKDSPRMMALKKFDVKKNEPESIGVTGVAGPFSPRKPLPYR